MAARGSILVEEFGFAFENELHGFAVGVDGAVRHGRELLIVEPDDVRQSCAEAGILESGHELGDDGGLIASEVGRVGLA